MRQAGGAFDTAVAVKCDLAGEVLRAFGSLRLGATGWSMLPSIWPGDTLVVERVRPEQVQIGDVVLVGRDGRLCAHRVISMTADSPGRRWVIQGDAMVAPDRPVSEGELLGRVGYVIRRGRLIEVRTELSVVERLTGNIAGRSVPAARALVYLHAHLHDRIRTSGETGQPCQDSPCQD
jgi:hypothetical protein